MIRGNYTCISGSRYNRFYRSRYIDRWLDEAIPGYLGPGITAFTSQDIIDRWLEETIPGNMDPGLPGLTG